VLSNLQEIAISGDRLVFNMAESTGNLWLFRPRVRQSTPGAPR
jgi:hypothetical protein